MGWVEGAEGFAVTAVCQKFPFRDIDRWTLAERLK